MEKVTTALQQQRTDCPLSVWTGTLGACQWCNTLLPAQSRRSAWCSDTCRRSYDRNHLWARARTAAKRRAKNTCEHCGVMNMNVDSNGHLWVANMGTASVLEFTGTASGDTAPLRSVSNGQVGMLLTAGVAVDTDGTIWAYDGATPALIAFNPNAIGPSAPAGTITGGQTLLTGSATRAVAVDGSGHLWARISDTQIAEYSTTG